MPKSASSIIGIIILVILAALLFRVFAWVAIMLLNVAVALVPWIAGAVVVGCLFLLGVKLLKT